jgi:hypothetical protein
MLLPRQDLRGDAPARDVGRLNDRLEIFGQAIGEGLVVGMLEKAFATILLFE